MKRLINAASDVTVDMLAGIALADRRVLIMPEYNVIVRADYATYCDIGRVALVSGGGSGHEPAHAGYVGAGMLTAAVAGEVFTSPSVDAVLVAIRLVTGPAGCLLIVKNYTGDRLNFGLAAALARAEGLKVAVVLVDDDVALAAGKSRAGARGLAGTMLVHKVAGAAAEAGATLEALQIELERLVPNIGTMGVGLSACTVPVNGTPSFVLADDEIEYGLGIHGEPGASREPPAAAEAIARRLIDTIAERKSIKAGARVVLMINGLGGTPPAELSIVAGSAIQICRERGFIVDRVMVGSFLTALEMAGCSITLAIASEQMLDRLDAPTDAPAWSTPLTPASKLQLLAAPVTAPALVSTGGPLASPAMQVRLRAAVQASADALIAAEPVLTELDSKVGDGDLGISMARGARAVLHELDALDPAHPAVMLEQISAILRRSVGGTSGPLYAALTLAVAISLREEGGILALADWARALAAGCQAITDLGGAKHGDRTMLDALVPATEALVKDAQGGSSADDALARAVHAARAGADRTAALDPRFGRSSYVGDRAIGHVDPGAEAVTVWLGALPKSDPQ
ncbi:dihydroxyacetone kinase subunit DhaK [Sphingomonas sp. So64.6b]|uniref:dihydroxyacetone kinase subunit DhaL n=1 Tax=Sphingomonas sp. So64.6b TaxID=2997354 RepID=UPI0016008CA5|nr:dihydroxyacetone kinase subunit DhaL [Sphingomonas sp. So64.6b]QNA82656.1 dihydroxyacetone kinase subunit DhaK [Sphingomonas sp. So64.6b]